MVADNHQGLDNLRRALVQTINDFIDRRLPLRRTILVSSILKNCCVEIPDHNRLINSLLESQKYDGGWVDCEDTAWSLYYYSQSRDCKPQFDQGLLWLESERCGNKGWGFCKRDQSCIPITALISYLLPNFPPVHDAMTWLEDEWSYDFHAIINLNYKAAWYLLAYCKHYQTAHLSQELFINTIRYLISEQRSDGSWGPWKKHPAPSECFITGICMAALSLSYSVSGEKRITLALTKGLKWIKDNQLDSGFFPTHYIEEGSAWIFFGWSNALTAMQGQSA